MKTTLSSPNFLPPTQLPRRSRTFSAWSALLALVFLMLMAIFYPVVLRGSVRFLLWAAEPITGLKIQSQELVVQWGKPLVWRNVTIISGAPSHESRCYLGTLSLEFTSPWRMILGDHLMINSLAASNGTVFIDWRSTELSSSCSFFKKIRNHVHQFFQTQLVSIASSCSLNNLSFSLRTNTESFAVEGLYLFLSKKNQGKFSYNKAFLTAEPLHCELEKGSCTTTWNGKTITFNHLFLNEEINLHSLQLTPHPDRIEFGLVSTLFHGLIRADGCIRSKDPISDFQGAILAQNVPLERLSKFLGLTKKVSGNLREGRLIFRGAPAHWIDAEASLRLLVDNFRYGKKEWAALSMTANLIGGNISLSNFQLKQHDNSIVAVGEMPLPQEWDKIGQAPFHLKIRADITDATQLGDLAGPPWNDITGALLLEGEIQGAAHATQGYFKARGTDIALNGLLMKAFKLDLLFKKETTDFQCSFHDLVQGRQHVSGQCVGSYISPCWIFSKFFLQEKNKQLSTTLSILPEGIEATHLSLNEDEHLLAGNLFLPLDTRALWNGGVLAPSFVFRMPLEDNLLSRCFSLAKKMLQGEPVTLMLPNNFYAPTFLFKKLISPSLLLNTSEQTTPSPLDIPKKEVQYYFYWK